MSLSHRRNAVIAAVLIALAIALPWVFPSRYVVGQLTLTLIWIIVASQWNLVFGVAGIFSLAHLSVFALGAYVTAIMSLYLAVPPWAAILVAALIGVVFSTVVGWACLRLQGAYVALLTLAITQAIYVLIITDTACIRMDGVTCDTLTGGARGLARFGDFGFREILPRGIQHFGNYYVVLCAAVLSLLFAYALMRSPLGLAFRALRDNRLYAMGRGVDRFGSQLLVFAASALFTAIAGGLYAVHLQVVGSNILTLPVMLFVLSMIIVGGSGTFWGPILGAVVLMLADEGLKEVAEWRQMGLGLVLIAAVMLFPRGLAGSLGGRLRTGQP